MKKKWYATYREYGGPSVLHRGVVYPTVYRVASRHHTWAYAFRALRRRAAAGIVELDYRPDIGEQVWP